MVDIQAVPFKTVGISSLCTEGKIDMYIYSFKTADPYHF